MEFLNKKFPVKSTQFSGLFRRYSDTGSPEIDLFPSSVANQWYAYYIFWYNQTYYHYCSGESDANSSLVIRINNLPFKITHYEIRSHSSAEHYMQAWTFEGSNDNVHYDMLDNRPASSDLISNSVKIYEVNKQRKPYRYFRIKQTVNTLSGRMNMRLSGLDIYGAFISLKCTQTKKSSPSIFMLISLITCSNAR